MSLGPEWGFVARMIRNDQDSLTQLLQLGLVVLVSVGRTEVMGEQEGGRLTPQPPPITFLLLQGSQESQESESPDTLRNVTIGLGVALLLVIVIFSTIIMCTQKRCCSHHPLCLQPPLSHHPRYLGVEKPGA